MATGLPGMGKALHAQHLKPMKRRESMVNFPYRRPIIAAAQDPGCMCPSPDLPPLLSACISLTSLLSVQTQEPPLLWRIGRVPDINLDFFLLLLATGDSH